MSSTQDNKNDNSTAWNKVCGHTLYEILSMDLPAKECLVGDWLEIGAPILVCGAPKAGKSFFAYALAYSISQGLPLFSWQCQKASKVIVLDGEMRPRLIQERLSEQVVASPCEHPENLIIVTRESFTENELTTPNISQEEEQVKLVDVLKRLKCEVLIVDNINAWFRQGNENETFFWKPFESFIFKLRDLGITPIIIHHTTKSNTKSPAGSSKAERVPEVIIIIEKIGDDVTNGAHFNVRFKDTRGFSKDTTSFSAKSISLEHGGLAWEIGEYIEQVNSSNNKKYNNDKEQEILKLREQNMSFSKIAKETGIANSTVKDIYRRLVGRTTIESRPSDQMNTTERC